MAGVTEGCGVAVRIVEGEVELGCVEETVTAGIRVVDIDDSVDDGMKRIFVEVTSIVRLAFNGAKMV
jgi:hypothetical protein